MPSSRPPLFDDGGGLPDTESDVRRGRDHGSGEPTRSAHRNPNYLVRRAIAVGVVVVVIALVAVVVGRVIGSEGDGGSTESFDSAWNRVVVVTADEVRLVDPASGDVVERYPADEPLLDAESLATNGVLVVMNDTARITQLDLADGTTRRSRATGESALLASRDHQGHVLAGPPLGGDVAIVDVDAGTTTSIGDVAELDDPLMFLDAVLGNAAGTHVATADATTFQSVVVDLPMETARLLAGQVVALDDRTVVTAQRAGDETELEFYDLTGERTGSVDVPTPVATMLTGESSALIVSFEGVVANIRSGNVVEIGPLTDDATIDPRDGHPALDDSRLVVTTGTQVVVLDDDGERVAAAPGELLTPVGRSTRCILVGGQAASSRAVHIDLDSGETLGEVAGGLAGSTSIDGCTVAVIAGTVPRIVDRGDEVPLAVRTGSVTVAPDGEAYAVSTFAGEELYPMGDPDADAVLLTDEPALVHFADVAS